MSGTARKKRKQRWHKLKKHWELVATKAQLLGDVKVEAAIKGGYVDLGQLIVYADTWMLQQMNIKPTSKSRERLRDALMRLRKQ